MGAVVKNSATGEGFNSYAFHVVDACGETFLHQTAVNVPGSVDKTKEHARWWIRHRRRPGAYRDTDSAGRKVRQPVGACRLVVEYYDDTSRRA
jgi:hypothetical protein